MSRHMKLILTSIALLLVLASTSAASDTWDGQDKQIHFVAGSFIGLGGYAYHDIVSPEDRERDKWFTGFVVGTFAGLMKEMYDGYKYQGFSGKDLVVTSAGAAVGSMIGVGIVYIDDTVFLSRTWRW